MKNFNKILQRTDIAVFQLFGYILGLIYLWQEGYGWFSLLFVHIFFVFLYGIFNFRGNFLIFFIAPITTILIPINNYFLKKYLRNFKQNVPAKTVIILGQSDFFKLEAWIKPNFFINEVKLLVRYLNTLKQDFSFYPKARIKDVEKIMSDKSIKEVYFFGHGDSHTFQLNTEETLYYCEFNDPEKYGKDYVHQVHCGTPYGKSLVDYVVPEENRSRCFFFRKTIN